jgi:hypothetical protein
MAGSHKEEVTGGRVVGHVPSKLEPSQTNKTIIDPLKSCLANRSISQQLKSKKKTKEIGVTIGKSNNEKKASTESSQEAVW